MSNHTGSYLLNDVLFLMVKYNILQSLTTETRYNFLVELTNTASDNYDCNSGEILDDIGEHFKICYCCLKQATDFENGLCVTCCMERN